MEQTFLSGRVGRVLRELERYLITEKRTADKMYVDLISPYALNPTGGEAFKTCKNGFKWEGKDRHCWLKVEFVIPEEMDGETITAELLTVHTDDWNIANPQFKVFQNGQLIQGMDVNHRDLLVCEKAIANTRYEYIFSAYSGTEDTPSYISFYYGIKQKSVQQVYFDLLVPYEVQKGLKEDDRRKTILKQILEQAVNILDFRDAKSMGGHFRHSLEAAAKFLKEEFYDQNLACMEPVVYGTGHTHIDIAWLWTLAQTREKAARSFTSALNLMDRYPEYIFFSSQPQLYEYVKEDYPQVFEQIKEKVKEGRWEVDGAMWLEADCNLTSGESLVRQIMFGKKFIREEFERDCKVLWLPDAFGYNAALPQILKKSGIDFFVTAKISWNEYNRMPYDVFSWRGIDESAVFTYFITTIAPQEEIRNFSEGFPMGTYNGILKPDVVVANYERFQQKELCDSTLLPYGYGDGGGGTTAEMIEIGRRLEKGVPGCPKFKFSSVLGFLNQIKQQIASEDLPGWVGELYLEYHRGTYTSRGKTKLYNRRAEELLQSTEFYAALAEQLNDTYKYPIRIFEENWKIVLRNQFHDILPGSSVKEVYADSDREYETVFKNLKEVKEEALNAVVSKLGVKKQSLFVINPTGFAYTNIAEADLPDWCSSIVDAEGREYPVQRVADHQAVVWVDQVPSYGFQTYELAELKYRNLCKKESLVTINERMIETPYFRVLLNEKAEFMEFYDKRARRQVLKAGGRGNVLQAFEDMPHNFDAWDIPVYYKEKHWEVDQVESIRVVEEGPVRWTLEVVKRFMNSKIIQKMHVSEQLPYIDIETEIHWEEEHVLLKTAFEVDIHADEAVYDIQFGNVRRPTHYNTSWDRAKFEVCAHKWAEISEEGYGVTLFNNCKYGHDIHDGVMRLTLLKSASDPYKDVDAGIHHFRYAFYPHEGSFRQSNVIPYAYAYNQKPATLTLYPQKASESISCGMASTKNENIVIETVKKSKDGRGIVLRLYEAFGKRGQIKIESDFLIESGRECNLMEEILDVLPHEQHSIEVMVKPYEIKTIQIKYSRQ